MGDICWRCNTVPEPGTEHKEYQRVGMDWPGCVVVTTTELARADDHATVPVGPK